MAFSNSDGGLILIGVRDDRTVIGRTRDQGLDEDIHSAPAAARYAGRYEISELMVEGKPVVAVSVDPRLDEVSQTSDGRVLVRRGGHNQPLFGHELQELFARRSLVRFEATDSRVPTTAVPAEKTDAVAKACEWPAVDYSLRWQERGLLHTSEDLTIAGALVLTDPAHSLGTAKFCVDIRSYEDDAGTSYVRRTTVTGPVDRQVADSTDLVIREVGTEMVVTGAYRHDVPRLPRRAVCEAIANAVAHRSYEVDAAPVVVEIRPGRVTITSPGRLPPPVTVATLRQAQAPRNQSVIAMLRRFRLAEDSGQGIDVIQDQMRMELLEERAWLAELEGTGRLAQEDRAVLLRVLRDGQVTNSRLRTALGLDSADARTSVQRLRDSGLVVQHGTRRRANYTLGVIGPRATDRQVVLDAAAAEPITNARVRELTGLERNEAPGIAQAASDREPTRTTR